MGWTSATYDTVGLGAQIPSLHDASLPHTTPQLPQLASSLSKSTQPSQSVSPAGHMQLPALQLISAVQVLPHAPQCVSFDCRSIHAPSQSDSLVGHAQPPFSQLMSEAQTFPHAPQLLSSEARSTHVSPQALVEPAHTQVAAEQTSSALQARSQAPQLVESELRSTHDPEQLVSPSAQVS